MSDQELLAKLIKCEAGGEGDIGMRAVASVVMNRVYAPGGEYARISRGGSLRNIIFQPGQFACAFDTLNGRYNWQNLFNMVPEPLHLEIAGWAISGNRLYSLGQALWFYNPYSAACRQNFPSRVGSYVIRIGKHCFYNPTDAYYQT